MQTIQCNQNASYVKVQQTSAAYLTLCEVSVWERASIGWTARAGTDRWCSKGNKDDYKQSDSSLPNWGLDNRMGHGWRLCGITSDECKAECIRMGGCVEIYMTRNGCCFPAKTRCSGAKCPGGCGGSSGHYRIILQGTCT